jgi:uncharacterized protein YdaU (DUF1376 family)
VAEFPALPLWTDAYLGDTTHLTTIEHGAYLLLLMTAWRTRDCCLPDDDRLLARYARCGPQQWKRLRVIIEPFFDVENGVWTQRRLTDERGVVERYRQQQVEKGKAGAVAKSLKRQGRDKAAAKSGLPTAKAEGEAQGEAQGQPDASSHLHTHIPLGKPNGGDDPEKLFWANAKAFLKPYCKGDPGALINSWLRDNGKDMTVAAINAAQLERAADPKAYIGGYFRRHKARNDDYNPDRITV